MTKALTKAPFNTFRYGLASLIDGLIMIGSGGLLLSTLRNKESLRMARKEMKRNQKND